MEKYTDIYERALSKMHHSEIEITMLVISISRLQNNQNN
jgi:hypothetical protein